MMAKKSRSRKSADTKHAHEPVSVPQKPKNEDLTKYVEAAVLDMLGTPSNMTMITSRNVYDNRWRVNVWTEYEVKGDIVHSVSQKIKHSYFVHFNHTDHKIIKADPEIKKEY